MLQAKLKILRDSLVGISNKITVCHYWRANLKAPFILWQEDGEAESLGADGRKAEQGIYGTVDYYTKTEYDPAFDSIQNVLNNLEDFSFRYESTEYEDETGLIHHTWEWRLRYGTP